MKRWRPSRRMRGKIRQNRHAGRRQGPAPEPRWERQLLQAHLQRMARAQIVSREFREGLRELERGFAEGPYRDLTTPNPAVVVFHTYDSGCSAPPRITVRFYSDSDHVTALR